MTFHVVFPAAGVGRRFGSELPKQYSLIQNKTVMEWTLRAFQSLPGLMQQVIAVQPSDEHAKSVLRSFPDVHVVDGGDERSDSVLSALTFLAQTARADDWVLVHDIARPCVKPDDILNLLSQCQRSETGGVLARRVTDTVKQVQSDGQIVTLDRTHLWTVQTPQCFRLGELSQALEYCQQNQMPVTDEASAMEAVGAQVQLVEGSGKNIKLTHPSDLALLDFYLNSKE